MNVITTIAVIRSMFSESVSEYLIKRFCRKTGIHKYLPHQGENEKARRRKQIERGILKIT